MPNPHSKFQYEMNCPSCAAHIDLIVREVFDWTPREGFSFNPKEDRDQNPARQRTQFQVNKNRPNHQVQGGKDKVTAYGFGMCPRCTRPVILAFNTSTHNLSYLRQGDENSMLSNSAFAAQYMELVGTIPEARTYSAPSELDDNVRQLWIATQESLDRGDPPSRIVSECRSVLDVCLKKLGQTEGVRKNRIENLKSASVITNDIAIWAKDLWSDGNDAVHDIEATKESAEEHVEFLRLFIRVAFELPAEIKRKQNATSEA